jgi:hypothetical protein
MRSERRSSGIHGGYTRRKELEVRLSAPYEVVWKYVACYGSSMFPSFMHSRAGTWELLSIAPIGRRRVD